MQYAQNGGFEGVTYHWRTNEGHGNVINCSVLWFLVILFIVTVFVILSTNALRTLLANSSVVPILLSMLGSVVVTLIFAVGQFYWKSRGASGHRLPYRMEHTKEGILRLEQQEAELEKQRAELERKQQMLIWQMEAVVLAKQDPRLAVVVAYQGVEAELQRVVDRRYPQDKLEELQRVIDLESPEYILEELDKQGPRIFHNISLLAESIDPESVEALKQMYELRNHIIHGEVQAEEISEQKAIEYVQNAIRLAGIISSITR